MSEPRVSAVPPRRRLGSGAKGRGGPDGGSPNRQRRAATASQGKQRTRVPAGKRAGTAPGGGPQRPVRRGGGRVGRVALPEIAPVPAHTRRGTQLISRHTPTADARLEAPEDLNYDQILKLFTSRHSYDLKDRHLSALEKVWRHNRDGYWVADLPHIKQLLSYGMYWAGEASAEQGAYVDVTARLVALGALPFRKRIASEEEREFDSVCAFVSTIGSLTQINETEIQQAAAAALQAYAEAGLPSEQEVASATLVTPSINMMVIHESRVLGQVVQGLRLATDPAAQAAILRTLKAMTYSQENCTALSRLGTPEVLARMVQDSGLPTGRDDFGGGLGPHISGAVEILWNILEVEEEARHQLDSRDAIDGMRALLVRLIAMGQRVAEQQVRNDVIVVLTLLAESPDFVMPHHFVDTGLVGLLVGLACGAELGRSGDGHLVDGSGKALPVADLLSPSNENFEFKQLLLNLVYVLCSSPPALDVAVDGGLVDFLLAHIRPAEVPTILQDWTEFQFHTLQAQALSMLFNVGAMALDAFRAADGVSALLSAIVAARDFGLKGAALQVVVNISEACRDELGDGGAVAVLLAVAADPVHPNLMQRDALLGLSALCAGHYDNKSIFHTEDGVSVVLPLLHCDVDDAGRMPEMTLAAVDLVWNAVVGFAESEDEFLARDGVYALLDLLDACPEVDTKNHVLGVLVDLLPVADTMSYLLQWRRDSDVAQGAVHALIDCWDIEQERLNVPLQNGVVVNLDNPLAPGDGDFDAAAAAAGEAPHTTPGIGQLGLPLAGGGGFDRRSMSAETFETDLASVSSADRSDELPRGVYGDADDVSAASRSPPASSSLQARSGFDLGSPSHPRFPERPLTNSTSQAGAPRPSLAGVGVANLGRAGSGLGAVPGAAEPPPYTPTYDADAMGVSTQPFNEPSPSILDVAENMRAKVFVVLRAIGMDRVGGIIDGGADDLALVLGETLGGGNGAGQLSRVDSGRNGGRAAAAAAAAVTERAAAHRYRMRLAVIQRYLDFKMGEVLHEVADELDMEGIRPISPDLERMARYNNETLETAKDVVAEQLEILRRQDDDERQREEEYYRTLIHGKRQEETRTPVRHTPAATRARRAPFRSGAGAEASHDVLTVFGGSVVDGGDSTAGTAVGGVPARHPLLANVPLRSRGMSLYSNAATDFESLAVELSSESSVGSAPYYAMRNPVVDA